MRRLALLVLPALALTGCVTHSAALRVDADHYIACDVGQGGPGDVKGRQNCGKNAAWGISKACLPQGRSIVGLRRGPASSVIVTCGPPIHPPRRLP